MHALGNMIENHGNIFCLFSGTCTITNEIEMNDACCHIDIRYLQIERIFKVSTHTIITCYFIPILL